MISMYVIFDIEINSKYHIPHPTHYANQESLMAKLLEQAPLAHEEYYH